MKIEQYLMQLKEEKKFLFEKDCPFPKKSEDIMENLEGCQIISRVSPNSYVLLVKFDNKNYDVEYKNGSLVFWKEKENVSFEKKENDIKEKEVKKSKNKK